MFSVLISNTDDHLRNHGFLYSGNKGWILSPLYDVNPNSDNKQVLSTYITEYDNSQSIELAFEVSGYFEISLIEAKNIIESMEKTVRNWRIEAKNIGLSKAETEKMESAFKV